jgi:hypothetical protein
MSDQGVGDEMSGEDSLRDLLEARFPPEAFAAGHRLGFGRMLDQGGGSGRRL